MNGFTVISEWENADGMRFLEQRKKYQIMATNNKNRNSEKGNQTESRTGNKRDENLGNSSARASNLDDTTLDGSEGSERAKQGRTDRATGSAEPMRKDDREAAQGRS